jgi:acyl carrier protein
LTTRDWGAEIVTIFREALGIELPSTSVDVLDTGILDSLALVTLLFEIEQRTGMQVPLEQLELDDLRTVDDMAGAVGRLHEPAA